MVVHIDVESGDVIKVTDERGRKALEGRINRSNPLKDKAITGTRG